jgi:dihydroorotate dehydrogenase
MPIEKDFSPTLAGDAHFSSVKETIRDWLKEVPRLIRAAAGKENISVGLKIFNAQFEDDFQVELLRACDTADAEHRADYLIYGNRLFDPSKEFEGKVGVAYGGPDLSARNLKVLSQYRPRLPFSATGDITTGKQVLEYLERGATSFQMHTLFQLPETEYAMSTGSRTRRALHRLLFNPSHGFIAAILDLAILESITLPVTIPSLISFFSLK